MSKPKPQTIERYEADLEMAKINLNNPKITSNAGLLAQTKARIESLEQIIETMKKGGPAPAKPKSNKELNAERVSRLKAKKHTKVKPEKKQKVAKEKKQPKQKKGTHGGPNPNPKVKAGVTIKWFHKKSQTNKKGEVIRVYESYNSPGTWYAVVKTKDGEKFEVGTHNAEVV